MATGTPADEGDIRIEEDDILDNGSDLHTSTDHMSEDPVSLICFLLLLRYRIA